MEVDHSFGALLMTWGLCTVPNHGEHCSTGAVNRQRAGEVKGLSKSGVNGAVRGLCGVPTMERANTEAGVFSSKVGLGLISSSVPEVTFKKKKTIGCKAWSRTIINHYVYLIFWQYTRSVRWSLSFTPSREWFCPAIGCYSVMIGYKSLGQIGQQGQTLLTDGIPVMRMATLENKNEKKIHFVFVTIYLDTSEYLKCVTNYLGHCVCVDLRI